MQLINKLPLKLFGFMGLALVILAIPLTVFLAQTTQTNQQHASGEDTYLYFSTQDSTQPLGSFTITQGDAIELHLVLNTQDQSINGFDTIIHYQDSFVPEQPVEDTDSSQFTSTIFNTRNNSKNIIRFSQVNTYEGRMIKGALKIGVITFHAVKPGTGHIEFNSAVVTSLYSTEPLSVGTTNLEYTIVPRPNGSQPTNNTISCEPDPQCTQGNKKIQICSLKCIKR